MIKPDNVYCDKLLKLHVKEPPRISKLGDHICAKKLLSHAKPVTEAAVLLKSKLYNNEKILM